MLPPGGRLAVAHRFGGERAYELQLPSHAAKVQLLDRLATYDAKHPTVRRLAEWLTEPAGSDELAVARALHAAVRDGVRFVDEPTETFQHTLRTWQTEQGDCDDSTRALVALARSIGMDARLQTLGNPPRHVWCQLGAEGQWWHAETSLAAELGEHPLDAGRRLGVLPERSDL